MRDVVAANRVEDLVDHRAWNQITMPYYSAADSYFTDVYVGVFGVDLLNFFTDCLLATSTNCDYETLVRQYDGWAIGAYFYQTYTSSLSGLKQGICFEDLTCASTYTWRSGSSYLLRPGSFTVADPSQEPNAANYNIPSAAYYGFNGVYFYTTASTWKELSEGILFYRFQSLLPGTKKYETGNWVDIYGFANWSAGDPHLN